MATHLVKGCCPLDCQDTCAWVAHVEDGRVVRLEGARDHPFTRGALCAKVNDYHTRTYAGDRLLHPSRRTGAKGSGAFERISWDEALDTIAERFTRIIAEHGAEALLPAFRRSRSRAGAASAAPRATWWPTRATRAASTPSSSPRAGWYWCGAPTRSPPAITTGT